MSKRTLEEIIHSTEKEATQQSVKSTDYNIRRTDLNYQLLHRAWK